MRRRRSRNHGGMPRSDLPGRRPPLRAFRAITVNDAVAGSAHLTEIGVQPSAATVRGYTRSPANRLVRYRHLPFQYRTDMVVGWKLDLIWSCALRCVVGGPEGRTAVQLHRVAAWWRDRSGGRWPSRRKRPHGASSAGMHSRTARQEWPDRHRARGTICGTQHKVGRRGQPHGFCRREPTPAAGRQAGLCKGGCGGTWREWMGAPRGRVRHSRCLR
jgi:hypothetical protein